MSNWKQLPVDGFCEFVLAVLEATDTTPFVYQHGPIRFFAVDDGTPRWIFEGTMDLPGERGTRTEVVPTRLIMVNGGTFDVRLLKGSDWVPAGNATAHFGIFEARRLAKSLPEVVTMGFGINTILLHQLWNNADANPGAVVGRLQQS